MRTFLTGASLVLPDRVASDLTLVIEGDRVVELVSGPREVGSGEVRVDLAGHLVVPGFIDVHVHGVEGTDVVDASDGVRTVARRLPRWGVTAFCPTSIACPPGELERFLNQVGRARRERSSHARVLPAHVESNFINPEYRGAQPLACLRLPGEVGARPTDLAGESGNTSTLPNFSAREILDVFDRHRADLGIVTLAPELPGALDLTRALVGHDVRVSLGHSAATFEEAQAAAAAGARQATHLFNRMRPMTHRDPGLVGAVLASEDLAAEIICDGHHVHPAVMRLAIAAKGPSRMLAITDGTAGSGLPAGSYATLGGQTITVGQVARLDDGTIAGSVLTMDRAFACLVATCGVDLVHAAEMCSTSPARELRLVGHGVIAAGAIADLAVLNSRLEVVETWIAGVRVWPESAERTLPD